MQEMGDSSFAYQQRYRALGALTTSDRYTVNQISAIQAAKGASTRMAVRHLRFRIQRDSVTSCLRSISVRVPTELITTVRTSAAPRASVCAGSSTVKPAFTVFG